MQTSKIDNWFIKQNNTFNELDKCANKYKLSFLQFDVLLHISEDKCSSPTYLAKRLKISRTSVSRILKALQSKELIVKEHDVFEDGRKIDIKVTSRGQKVINELSSEIVTYFEKIGI